MAAAVLNTAVFFMIDPFKYAQSYPNYWGANMDMAKAESDPSREVICLLCRDIQDKCIFITTARKHRCITIKHFKALVKSHTNEYQYHHEPHTDAKIMV